MTGIGNMHVNTKQTRDRQQPNYTNARTKNKFSGHCSSALLFLLVSQSENTLYTHVVFFLVFAGTNPFNYTNISSSFNGCINRAASSVAA